MGVGVVETGVVATSVDGVGESESQLSTRAELGHARIRVGAISYVDVTSRAPWCWTFVTVRALRWWWSCPSCAAGAMFKDFGASGIAIWVYVSRTSTKEGL